MEKKPVGNTESLYWVSVFPKLLMKVFALSMPVSVIFSDQLSNGLLALYVTELLFDLGQLREYLRVQLWLVPRL